MARIGYARVSSTDQDLSIQLERLKSERCDVIRSEKVSGASREGRGELATVIEFLRPGDELVVARLDRLGRDTRDVLNIVHEVEQRGSGGGGCGEVEEGRERQREGIDKAKRAGVYRGGKRRLDHEKIRTMHATGSGPTAIAKALNCSRVHVYRVLATQ